MKNQTDTAEPDKGFIGIVIVSYCSGDYLLDCLDTVLKSTDQRFKIVVCDNNSPDNTVAQLRGWARETHADFADYAYSDCADLGFDQFAQITLLRVDENLGFAGGVNAGIKAFMPHKQVDLFWVLNPDCQVHPDAVAAYRSSAEANPGFGLMGSRVIYMDAPNQIQSDGGIVNKWTGLCKSLNQGQMPDDAARPGPDQLDFVSGSNVVASRAFVETVGLMAEEYFLYYEEVDWAARRGNFPIAWSDEAIVYHHGGTVIGSGAVGRTPTAFANYFNFRNRVWYMRRFRPIALPSVYVFSALKVCQYLLRREWQPAMGALRGTLGLPPSPDISQRLGARAQKRAFGLEPTGK